MPTIPALARQRQDLILAEVAARGGVRVAELVERLGVSDMTVRRDIEVLAARGLVARVHGGVTVPALGAAPGSADEPGFAAKSTRQTAEKRAIARVAADLVEPGGTVALSAGTTTAAVADLLRDVPNLTVVTNSLAAARTLHASPRSDQTVVLTGGVRTPSDALVGPVAVGALADLHVDVLLLGVHGMHDRAGLTTPNLLEGETDRALARAASRLVVVADHTKWGVVGLARIAPLDDVDVLVTDSGLGAEAREVLGDRVGRLVVAETAVAGGAA